MKCITLMIAMATYCFLHDLDAFAPHRCFHTKTVLFLSFSTRKKMKLRDAFLGSRLFFSVAFNPFVEGLYRAPLPG